MIVVGLTGGIGAGKSTVSALLAEHGAVVIDADAIVHEVQSPGHPVLARMVERFGDGILRPDGTLERQAVADIVFGDDEALKALGEIVHPAVGEEIATRMAAESETDHVVILDVPLLVESGRDDMAATIVVDVDPEVAVERLVGQRGMSEADARARIKRQASREERLAKADHVIDNHGDRDALRRRVAEVWSQISAIPDAADRQGEQPDH